MFLVRPRPLVSESLSCWRQRSGLENGFQRFPVADGTAFPHDPDRLPRVEDQRWLTEQLAVTYADIQAMSLEPHLLRTQRRSDYSPKWRWLLPTGSKASPPICGPTACVECLKEGPTPYFRIEWRLAFLTDCPIHGVAMIDRCPGCGSSLWPAAVHQISRDRQLSHMAECPKCGSDLRQTDVVDGGTGSRSRELWQSYLHDSPPERFAFQCGAGEFFDAIYLLVQLFLRRHSRRILSVLPDPDPPVAAAPGDVPSYIEACEIGVRRTLITRAVWLLEEWPTRFLEHVQKASLSRTHSMMTTLDVPSWFAEVVDRELSLTKRSSPGQVADAVEQISARGEPVTKSAVRRELGVSQSWAADEILSRREHARVDELLALCGKFERALKTTPQSRAQYASVVRDYSIFLLSVLREESADVVCGLDRKAVLETIQERRGSEATEFRDLIRQRARDLDDEYSTSIRPGWVTSSDRSDAWFITRFGEPFEGHGLRERVAKLMRTGFPKDLWHSADVFISVLGEPKLGRRAARRLPGLALSEEPDMEAAVEIPLALRGT